MTLTIKCECGNMITLSAYSSYMSKRIILRQSYCALSEQVTHRKDEIIS